MKKLILFVVYLIGCGLFLGLFYLLLSLIVPLANDNGQWKVLGALGAFALSIVTFNAIGSLVLEPLFLTRLERWANAAPYSAGLGSQYPENCDALKQRILA